MRPKERDPSGLTGVFILAAIIGALAFALWVQRRSVSGPRDVVSRVTRAVKHPYARGQIKFWRIGTLSPREIVDGATFYGLDGRVGELLKELVESSPTLAKSLVAAKPVASSVWGTACVVFLVDCEVPETTYFIADEGTVIGWLCRNASAGSNSEHGYDLIEMARQLEEMKPFYVPVSELPDHVNDTVVAGRLKMVAICRGRSLMPADEP